MDKKCVRIEIEYNDGTVEYQNGPAADEVWSWLMGAQSMYCIHGAVYKGPQFIERRVDGRK